MTSNPFSDKTLAVMLGGTAAERSISLESDLDEFERHLRKILEG